MTADNSNSHTTGTLTALSNELSAAVEAAGPATVTVDGRRRLSATGIVWSQDGLIVTANHVVERDDDLSVTLPEGDRLEAELVGRDQRSDTAVLRIDGTSVSESQHSDTTPKPGHLVLAVGRPGPSGLSASLGVVSLVGGPWKTGRGSSIDRFVRSDVAMLPGFSGGPLIDSVGSVIGMNSSTLGGSGGLAIPTDVISPIVDAILAHGKVRRGYLGIGAQSLTLNNHLVESLEIDQDHGLVVVGLEPGGPGETAGLLLGDIILSIDGTPVSKVEELQDYLTGEIVGKTVTLQHVRGGLLVNLDVEVAERR